MDVYVIVCTGVNFSSNYGIVYDDINSAVGARDELSSRDPETVFSIQALKLITTGV